MSCREMMRRRSEGWLVSSDDHSWHNTLTADLQKCAYCGEYRDLRSPEKKRREQENFEWNGYAFNHTRNRRRGWWRDDED